MPLECNDQSDAAQDGGSQPADLPQPPVGSMAIPGVEPPARLSSRFSASRRSLRMIRSSLRQTPSWLASLTVHLAVLLLFGSLLVPVRIEGRSFDVVLLLAELNSPNDEGDLAVFETAPRLMESELNGGQNGEASESVDREESPVVETPPSPEEELEEPAEESGAGESEPSLPVEPEVDLGLEIPSVLMSVFAPFAEDRIDSDESAPIQPVPPGLDVRNEDDETVDDFIEYDIGRLRGEEGEAALRRFKDLGPDAIPALVRGLNKSAGIRASCPVIVLSQRLENQLRKSHDPIMIRYALDHIGDDVDRLAPHRGRLKTLRKRIVARFDRFEEDARTVATKFGVPMTRDLLRRVKEAASLADEDLQMDVASSDPRTRVAGLLATALRSGSIEPEPGYKLSMVIAEQMEGETDPRMLSLQNRTLFALAIGGVNAEAGEEVHNRLTAQEWKADLRARRLVLRSREAQGLLAKAKRLKNNRRSVEAGKVLRQISEEYADTSVADEARVELSTLDLGAIPSAKFNRARLLESAGNETAAIRFYVEIIAEYPKTSAAAAAKQRLNELRAGGVAE